MTDTRNKLRDIRNTARGLASSPTPEDMAEMLLRIERLAADVLAAHAHAPADRLDAITCDWDETNRRRCELIDKQLGAGLSADEAAELEALQALADKRIQLLAPLPIDQLADLERVTKQRDALLAACQGLCVRMEVNELVNRPDNPCNHYDQPVYDAARTAIANAAPQEDKPAEETTGGDWQLEWVEDDDGWHAYSAVPSEGVKHRIWRITRESSGFTTRHSDRELREDSCVIYYDLDDVKAWCQSRETELLKVDEDA